MTLLLKGLLLRRGAIGHILGDFSSRGNPAKWFPASLGFLLMRPLDPPLFKQCAFKSPCSPPPLRSRLSIPPSMRGANRKVAAAGDPPPGQCGGSQCGPRAVSSTRNTRRGAVIDDGQGFRGPTFPGHTYGLSLQRAESEGACGHAYACPCA